MLLLEALRSRLRDWRVSLPFSIVLGGTVSLLIVCLAIAWPVLWAPLPAPNGTRILALTSHTRGQNAGLSWQDAEDLRTASGNIEKIAVSMARTWGVQTETNGPVEVLRSVLATGELLEILGAHPDNGATLTPAHNQSGNQNHVWLTSARAIQLFGTNGQALGRTLYLNAVPYRVAGILSNGLPTFHADLLMPLPRAEYCCLRGGGLSALALYRDPSTAQSELPVLSALLESQHPATNTGRRFHATPLRESLYGPRAAALRWLLAGLLCLVAIAAMNGSGLWMARWQRERRDQAIRISLGASSGRLAGIRAAEGAIAGIAAGVLGALLARMLLATPLLRDALETYPAELYWHAALAGLVLAAAVGIASALVPHWLLARRMASAGTRQAMSGTAGSQRFRLLLVTVQLSGTAVLAWVSIAIGENVLALLTAPNGFRTEQILRAGIGIPESRYNTDERMIAFHSDAVRELRKTPGAADAASGIGLPQGTLRTRFLMDGQTLARDRQPMAAFGIASPELLPLLGMRLVAGRNFTGGDRWNAPRIALVNESFVRTHMAELGNPLDQGVRISFYNGFAMKPYTRFQIAGVFADARNDALLPRAQPQILIASTQIAMEGFTYFVRTTLPHGAIGPELANAVRRVDPALQRLDFRPLDAHLEAPLADRKRMAALGLLLFAAAALLAGAGLHSSLSTALVESERELALRAALGAGPARIAWESARWVLVSAAVAAATAALIAPIAAASVPLEKSILRPNTWNTVATFAAMAAITLISALPPAARAALLPPVLALRGK